MRHAEQWITTFCCVSVHTIPSHGRDIWRPLLDWRTQMVQVSSWTISEAKTGSPKDRPLQQQTRGKINAKLRKACCLSNKLHSSPGGWHIICVLAASLFLKRKLHRFHGSAVLELYGRPSKLAVYVLCQWPFAKADCAFCDPNADCQMRRASVAASP